MRVYLLISFCTFAAAAKLKPAKEYFNICHISDPKYEECLKKTVMDLKPALLKGIPELKIIPLEPLRIQKIEMGSDSGNFKLHFTLFNLTIHGIKGYDFKSLRFDPKTLVLNMTTFFPKLDFDGDYIIDGQVLILPIKGNGQATLNFTDITTRSYAKMEKYNKEGKTYYKITETKLSIEPKSGQSYFTNLFNGDKVLGESTNKFLNDNWRDAFYTYKELPNQAFSELFKNLANRFFTLFPADELFPK